MSAWLGLLEASVVGGICIVLFLQFHSFWECGIGQGIKRWSGC